ncbi:MAG: hypothetical protein E6H55_04970 [Betaproteobacteria bacterium]|nr:MAG: hypothetical protein E6H55_04970 [Betaproteobacteria bacterium]
MPSQPPGRISSSKKRTIWQAIDRHDRRQLADEPETARRASMTGSLCIGIDVGGTFTDLFMVDDRTGDTFRHKLSSTPDDPHEWKRPEGSPRRCASSGSARPWLLMRCSNEKARRQDSSPPAGFAICSRSAARPAHTFTI